MNQSAETMDFGDALRIIKDGGRAQRRGWNGKGMYIYLCTGEDTPFDPALVLHTAQGTEQIGWLASQSDMLAVDWVAW